MSHVSSNAGLTTTEAAARLAEYGPKQVETGRRFRVLREGFGLLANPLVLILLVAAIVSGILGEPLDAGIIVVVVLLSVGLRFLQVFRSDQAAKPGRADHDGGSRWRLHRDPRTRGRTR